MDRLSTLRRKPGVRRLREIKIKPYADQLPQPPLPCTRPPHDWVDFIFVDDSGDVWLVDGINDEGFGDAVIYSTPKVDHCVSATLSGTRTICLVELRREEAAERREGPR